MLQRSGFLGRTRMLLRRTNNGDEIRVACFMILGLFSLFFPFAFLRVLAFSTEVSVLVLQTEYPKMYYCTSYMHFDNMVSIPRSCSAPCHQESSGTSESFPA